MLTILFLLEGFGAAVNSFLDLVNVEEWDPTNSVPSGLHRSKDPGVGAFSTYHDRKSTAKVPIKKGQVSRCSFCFRVHESRQPQHRPSPPHFQELFVNYGTHW